MGKGLSGTSGSLKLPLTGMIAMAAAAAGSCKETEFNHFVNPPPAPVHAYAHALKEVRPGGDVDILWVIDNSASMRPYQQNVIRNTAQFMQTFTSQTGVDWKMGLLSSDELENPYLGFTPQTALDFRTPNPVSVFQDAVEDLGTDGSGTEKFFTPVLKNLRSNPGFIRQGAVLALIFLSDATEQSGITATSFMTQLGTIKGSMKEVVTYAALVPSEFRCNPPSEEGEWSYAGSPYETVVKATQGKVYSACDVNFGNSLADLSKDIFRRVSSPRMYLSARPRPGSLVIRYRGQALPGGPKSSGGYWIYDFELNAVLFHDLDFAAGDAESVEVSFRQDDGIERPDGR